MKKLKLFLVGLSLIACSSFVFAMESSAKEETPIELENENILGKNRFENFNLTKEEEEKIKNFIFKGYEEKSSDDFKKEELEKFLRRMKDILLEEISYCNKHFGTEKGLYFDSRLFLEDQTIKPRAKIKTFRTFVYPNEKNGNEYFIKIKNYDRYEDDPILNEDELILSKNFRDEDYQENQETEEEEILIDGVNYKDHKYFFYERLNFNKIEDFFLKNVLYNPDEKNKVLDIFWHNFEETIKETLEEFYDMNTRKHKFNKKISKVYEGGYDRLTNLTYGFFPLDFELKIQMQMKNEETKEVECIVKLIIDDKKLTLKMPKIEKKYRTIKEKKISEEKTKKLWQKKLKNEWF